MSPPTTTASSPGSTPPRGAEEQLRRIEAVTDSTLAYLDFDALLDTLLERARDVLDADTAAILLLDDSKQELVAAAAKGIEEEARTRVRIPVGYGFAGRIAAEQQPVILERVDHTTVVNPILLIKGVRSLVGVPLVAHGATVGVLHVGTLSDRPFTEKDSELLQLVADRAALAISAAISKRERIAADALQRSLAPSLPPTIDGLEIAARYIPGLAGAVGGDWFDVFRLANGRVAVAIGDVAGHGLRSAVVMGRLRSALRAYALESDDPATVLDRLDVMACHFEPEAMATVLYGVFDPTLEHLIVSSAGHPSPILARTGASAAVVDVCADPPIGTCLGGTRRVATVRFPAGASLYLYTDGVVERRGADISAGLERLCALATPGSPHDACGRIVAQLVGEDDPSDDIAFLALHRPR